MEERNDCCSQDPEMRMGMASGRWAELAIETQHHYVAINPIGIEYVLCAKYCTKHPLSYLFLPIIYETNTITSALQNGKQTVYITFLRSLCQMRQEPRPSYS